MATITQSKESHAQDQSVHHKSVSDIFQKQKSFFHTLKTRDLDFRLLQLKTLYEALNHYEKKISEAMFADLKRSRPLTYYSEIGMSLKSISLTMKNLKRWTKPKKVKASWDLYPLSKCWVQFEPLGQTLLISPWNYPITLTMGPLTAAISAGNTAILKPSELSSHVSQVIAEMIGHFFDEEYITVFQGDKEVATELLELPFDHIMYTGGTAVGKIVMQAAAKNLTPVTLELGGKSPTIVDKDIDLVKTARRIVMGKFINCGQTCIAPDHVYAHESIVDDLIIEIKNCIFNFFGEDPKNSPDYGKIINNKHFSRICSYLNEGKVIAGGASDEAQQYIEPTLMTDFSNDASILEEEIFGPILPIFTYTDLDHVLKQIRVQPKPLALYLFSNDKNIQHKVLSETSSGGVAINDTITQFISMNLPFGGVGNSGMGRYHGKYGFETFSHHRAVLRQTNMIDLKMKYPPVTEKTVNTLKYILK